ncbi:T9SS type A sorting domain-containing protein [Winogradskyella psychrotolerans]|uniref:T9SS type A sorting domain-containing protein n=1 Tax=Winogradskyella psychrotolerans TaxID=1344585 RepID=UPI001C06B296|nr:T9SS type A sorting domain-containing protein [Winogradskyella psychrotolerans]MBU2920628.1 T9SS type A sorting domain-containing protein [Winogradskyella psychrotolerans]
MKKTLLFLSVILLLQTNEILAQTIELPSSLYLCDTGSLELDGTVINTTDTNITYQWYYSISLNVSTIPSNEITGATNPILTLTGDGTEYGYYKVLATLSDGSVHVDQTKISISNSVNTYLIVDCDFFLIQDLQNYYELLYTSNITFSYYQDEIDAIEGNDLSADSFYSYDLYNLYLRIEVNDGECVDIIPLDIYVNSIYAYWVPNMGDCSIDATDNVFDLTTNDAQIIGGQQFAVVNYFVSYNDANNLNNPITNASNYTALSPNQTIYARVYDPNNTNFNCDPSQSIIQFQLLSISEPTPNTELDYIVCDTTSGSDTDGIGAFDLTSRNTLVLSGLSTYQYNISYYNTLVDADANTNPILSPNNYIGSNEVIYVRVESSLNSECVQISQMNLIVQDTCDDISVNLLSYWQAPRPGFTYRNMLIVKNNGESTVSSGSVTFANDAIAAYSGATGLSAGNTITPTATGFTLDFVDLLPGESEVIYIDLLVSTSANLGDMITNVAEYTTSSSDVVIENNTSSLSEIIIGSYDPNDINESHGPEIEHVSFTEDDYLYYTIRFQNVGTASAINVIIENTLDPKLDKTTFQMLSASHSYGIERDFDNLTWNFYNINLADETTDEPNSHGFVYYKIKPLAGYEVGDIVPNTAAIVFDFNEPVITNTFNTEFVAPLSISENSIKSDYLLSPNPSKDMVSLSFTSTQSNIEIAVFDILGKMVLTRKMQQVLAIDLNISVLEKGVYFVKVKNDIGELKSKKIIKE